MSEIRKSLKALMQSDPTAIFAKIISVDEVKATCSASLVSNEDMILEGVRLQAIDDENDNGFILIPAISSIVMLVCAEKVGENAEYIVVMCSKIDKINLKIDNVQKLKITKTLIEFNGGAKGSMVEIAKLKTQLNTLENAFNALLSNYKAHNHLHPNGPTTAFVVPSIQSNLAQTQITDLENAQIKQ